MTLTAGSEETRAPPRRRLASRVGRYILLDEIGRGGMGVVYSAFDPELERRIAVKVIDSARVSGSDPSQGERRLIREAQAIARLSHPNVIHVYDVGKSDDDVFVAMELIDGQTLKAWAAQGRSWREILAVYCQAGRGLAAAHAAGLVHRDFKPENVLVDHVGAARDVRARVLDFGLARAPEQLQGAPTEPSLTSSGKLERLTLTGAVAGTPAYMSPEQFEGKELDAASDQFSFCVALLEALDGQRPFIADNFAELFLAVVHEDPRPPPPDSTVPTWLREAILRGLAKDPSTRYGSMNELLAALERDPARLRKRILFAVGVTVLVGGTGFAGWSLAQRGACTSMEEDLSAVWNDARKTAVREALAAGTDGGQTWEAVRGELGAYAAQWQEMQTASCRATFADGVQPRSVYDLRQRCLLGRRESLRNVVDVLADLEPDGVGRAEELAKSMAPIAGCGDVEALQNEVAPPDDPAAAKLVEEHRASLDRARALKLAGRGEEAERLAASVVPAARELGYMPLLAEAQYWVGEAALQHRDPAKARKAFSDAVAAALAGDHREYVLAGLVHLIFTAREDTDPTVVESWYSWAKALLESRKPDPSKDGMLEGAIGIYYMNAGDYEKAYRHMRTDAELSRVYDTPQNLAMTLNNLGEVCRKLRKYDEATALGEEALAIRKTELDPDHPDIAMSYVNLGILASTRGDKQAAEDHYRAALPIYEAAGGPGSPQVAIVRTNLGALLGDAGRVDEGIEQLERALEIREAGAGPDSPVLISTLTHLSRNRVRKGQPDVAVALAERAVKIADTSLGDRHPKFATALVGLARAQLAAGNPTAARDAAGRADAISDEPEVEALLRELDE